MTNGKAITLLALEAWVRARSIQDKMLLSPDPDLLQGGEGVASGLNSYHKLTESEPSSTEYLFNRLNAVK